MWFSNRGLTLVVLPILPIAFAVFFWFGGMAQPLFMGVQIRLSALNTVLQENVAGLKVVRAFGREPHEQERFNRSADAVLEQQLKVGRTFSFLFPVIFLIANLGQAAVLYFGGRQIIDGTLTIGEWQKFSLYLAYLFLPMGQLGFIINLMSQASASAQRIFEILDTQNEIANKPGALELDSVTRSGPVRRRDVPLLQRRRAGAERRVVHGRARTDGRAAGRHRQRQVHHHQPAAALLRRLERPRAGRRPRRARRDAREPARADRHRAAGDDACSAAPSATTSPTADPTPVWTRSWRPPARPPRTTSSWSSRAATTRRSASAAPR